MQFERVNEFLTLAKTLEYRAAAAILGISPPTLTQHIKQLEDELGLRLFSRKTRSVALSEYGAMLLPVARQLAGIENEYKKELSEPWPCESCRQYIGLSPMLAESDVVELLFRFRKECPYTDVRLFSADSPALREKVLRGDCDLAFVQRGPELAEDALLETRPFRKSGLSAVLPPTHALAAEKSLSLARLKGEELLLPGGESLFTEHFLGECRLCGFEPVVLYSGAPKELVDLAARGYGTAVLPDALAPLFTPGLVCAVSISDRPPVCFDLVYRRDNYSPALYYFLMYIASFMG